MHPRNPAANRHRPRLARQQTPTPAFQFREPVTEADISRQASVARSLALSAASSSRVSNPHNDTGAGVYRWLWSEEGGSQPPQEFSIQSDDDEAKPAEPPDAQQPRTSRESFLQSLRRTVSNAIGGTAATQNAATPVVGQPHCVTSSGRQHGTNSHNAAAASPNRIHRSVRRTSNAHSIDRQLQGGSMTSTAAPRVLSGAMRRLIHQLPQGRSTLGPAGASRSVREPS